MKIKLSLLALVAVLGIFSGSHLLQAQDACSDLKVEMTNYLQQQEAQHRKFIEKADLFTQTLSDLHGQLRQLENKTADDLSWAIGSINGIQGSINNLAEEIFALSDQNYEKSESWANQVKTCFGSAAKQDLENWATQDVEILGTIGGVYYAYLPSFNDWTSEWKDLQKQKAILREGEFDYVEAKAGEFQEASVLSADLYEQTRTVFQQVISH